MDASEPADSTRPKFWAWRSSSPTFLSSQTYPFAVGRDRKAAAAHSTWGWASARRRIDRVGMQATACAVGQASAAIFARHAVGRSEAEIARGRKELEAWLVGSRTMPDWPDIQTIAPAREYPARHGAILLPWRAATEALSISCRPR